MRHIDLFSGIGGFALASRNIGIETVCFSEIDPYCAKVLKKNFPDVVNLGDVRHLCRRTWDNNVIDDGYVECRYHEGEDFADCECIGTDQFLDEYGWGDIITAGFPCQDVSNARTPHGEPEGINGKRSELWRESARIIEQISPNYILIENVPSLKMRGYDTISAELEGIGYAVWPFVVGAWAAGGSIKRNRVWIVGIQKSMCEGLERDVCEKLERAKNWGQNTNVTRPVGWGSAPRICRVSDGISKRVDRLKSLGNSIYPYVAQIFMEMFVMIDNARDDGKLREPA